MDAILLCIKKRGIRFFSKISFPNTQVIRFHAKHNFMGLLRTRIHNFDNVLLMAHGSNKSILTTTNDLNHPYITYISADEVDSFKNDFVFAVSCSTANEFGKRCIEQGAIAYLGYQVELGCLFYSYSSGNCTVPKRITSAVDTIIKHIFIEELSRAYEEFLLNPINVSILKERFSFLLEKRIARLSNMTPTELYAEYHVSFSERDIKKFVVDIVLRVLSYLDDILPRLVCLGDENYFSASYITYRKQKGVSTERISEELEMSKAFQSLSHIEYKEHLRELTAST